MQAYALEPMNKNQGCGLNSRPAEIYSSLWNPRPHGFWCH